MERADRRDRMEQSGRWLRSSREAAGISISKFAGMIGVGPVQVSNYETGKNAIDDERAERIAVALALPLIEVRRNLGLWVPDGPPQPAPDVLAAIAADPRLTDETKEHLRAQYGLLRQASDYVRGVVDEFTLRAARYQADTGGDLEVQAEIRRRLADYMRRVGRTELTADEIGRAITGD